MTLQTRFDYLTQRREAHIQLTHDHAGRRCGSTCFLCHPYEHTHTADCPVRGCFACDRLVEDAMLDEAMREESRAS